MGGHLRDVYIRAFDSFKPPAKTPWPSYEESSYNESFPILSSCVSRPTVRGFD